MTCDGRPLPRRLLEKSKRTSFPAVSALFLAALALACGGAALFDNGAAAYMDLSSVGVPPGQFHLFGTDSLGRDIFRMIFTGGAVSLTVGFGAASVSAIIGVAYGCLSGVSSGGIDNMLMGFCDILLSVPSILLVLFVQAALGRRSPAAVAFAIGVTSWVSVAKITRTETRRVWQSEAVYAARFAGAGFFYLLRKHLVPAVIPAVMFMIVTNAGAAVAAEATLSFLGLGLPPDVVSWGSMLSLSEQALLSGDWWIIFIPCGFLIASVAALTDLGEYVRKRNISAFTNL